MTRWWESKGAERKPFNLASLIYPIIAFHYFKFPTHCICLEHTGAANTPAKLQRSTRLHEVSSKGRGTQVGKVFAFHVNRSFSWTWPFQEKRSPELDFRKYLALLGFLATRGWKAFGRMPISLHVRRHKFFQNPSYLWLFTFNESFWISHFLTLPCF